MSDLLLIAKESSPTGSAPAAPSPELCGDDRCHRLVFAVCLDCGEASHAQIGEALFAHDHSACDAGWEMPDLCRVCQAAEERAAWYDLNGHGFHCTCGCNGH